MHLFAAIALTLLRNALIILALMMLLFGGFLLFAEAGPTLREFIEAPQRLDQLEIASRENVAAIAASRGEATAHTARRLALEIRLDDAHSAWQKKLDQDLQAIEDAANEQALRVERTIEENRQKVSESIQRVESRYCDSWNPIDWWTCRAVRRRAQSLAQGSAEQRKMIENATRHLQEQARQDLQSHRSRATEELEKQTAELHRQRESSLAAMENIERERRALEERITEIQAEEALLREANWLWLEFRRRLPHLLILALLIVAAPYLRRTLWYFVGMPLVSRARPIVLADPSDNNPSASPDLICSESARMLSVDVAAGQLLRARPGYIQSDRQGAKTELFFDRKAPNLSFLSGLVLLTRLQSRSDTRQVLLGAPHDPDAYLMRVDLRDHPGIVLRPSRVIAVTGDIQIQASWRLTNLHAWATSQLRFIIFSGTGTLILEGYGDVHATHLTGTREEKRMPQVLGFDTRLHYQTRRSATFLPYLIDPTRQPLVVDVFDGQGTLFFEKNPSARARHRSTGEVIAGFFLDAARKLLGI